jgi:uncharacterized protein
MTRLLFWIALIILVVMAVRTKLRAMLNAQTQAPGPAHGPAQGATQDGDSARGAYRRVEDESERMSCCAQCGVYFPSSEAVTVDGRDYCSPAHAHKTDLRKSPH